MEILGFIIEVEECLRPIQHPCFDVRALSQLPRRDKPAKDGRGTIKEDGRRRVQSQ